MNSGMFIRTVLICLTLFTCIFETLADEPEKKKIVIPDIPKVKLKSGYEMPILGFGTGRQGLKSIKAFKAAIEFGYRLFDAAKIYMTAPGVAVERVLGKLIQESGIPREEFFIVTKIIPSHFSEESCKNAIEQSLEYLKTSYVDLVLIHSPTCDGVPAACAPTGSYIDGWKSLEALVDKGWIRSIGLSNFVKEEFFRVHEIAKHPISVLQNWFDPFEQDKLLRIDCEYMNVVYMSYSTLGGTWFYNGVEPNPVLNNNVITKIGEHHNVSSAEVVLQWAMAGGAVVIPSSGNICYIEMNLKSLNLKLTDDEMSQIDQLYEKKDEIIEKYFAYETNSPNDEL